ncbi:MAG TPA: T9SS type A sorting domain-containing protein [Bacteroidales bacterium]|nr:T9SS type A sorting domain-containing protein [Bacteroidales bacterium]
MKINLTKKLMIALSLTLMTSGAVLAQSWGTNDDHLMPLSHNLVNGMFVTGPFSHAQTENNLLYYTDYQGFNIYDVSNLAAPVKIGECPVPGNATHFFISGTYAYVCNGFGIAVIDISNPASPDVVNVEFLGFKPYQVIIDGNHAYVAESNGVRIYSMPDPEHLNALSTVNITPGNILFAGIALYNQALFYVNQSTLSVINISLPSTPVLAQSIALSSGGACWGNMAVHGQYLYVVSTLKLNIYDIFNPLSPIQMYAALPTSHTIFDIVIENNKMVLNHSSGSWTVLDISSPANPVVLYANTTTFTNGLYSLGCLKNDVLYILDNGQPGYAGYTLHLTDLSNVTSPSVISEIESLPGKSKSVALLTKGEFNYALVVQDNDWDTESATSMLRVLNVNDPANPLLVSTLELPKGGVSITTDNQNQVMVGLAEYAFPYYVHSVALVNLDDVNNPFIMQITSLGQSVTKLINSNLCYFNGKCFAITGSGLKVFDVGAGSLTQLGNVQLQVGFAVHTNNSSYIYTAEGADGFRMYNVTNPSMPYMTGFYNTPGTSWDVFVDNGKGYVADYEGGLAIFDVSMNNIVPLSQVSTVGRAISVCVYNQIAYVGMDDGRIEKFDVSNPAVPVSLGWYLTNGSRVNDLTLDAGTARLYVGNELEMMILQMDEAVSIQDHDPLSSAAFVYPNPAGDQVFIRISTEKAEEVIVSITDASGRMVNRGIAKGMTAGMNYFRINTEGLKRGLYFVEIQTGKTLTREKIIIR